MVPFAKSFIDAEATILSDMSDVGIVVVQFFFSKLQRIPK